MWSDEFTAKKDIASQGALATCSYIASRGIKRLREQASAGAAASETLANTMRENETLKQDKDKLQRDYDEAIGLANERQKGARGAPGRADQGFLMQEGDFSCSPAAASRAFAGRRTPHQLIVGSGTPALETVKAEASRAAAMAGSSRGATRSRARATCCRICSTAAPAVSACTPRATCTAFWAHRTARALTSLAFPRQTATA